MINVKVPPMVNNIISMAVKHSPEILVGVGIASLVGSIVTAVRATPPAMKKIDEKKKELKKEELTVKETVQTTWKCYVPTVIFGISGIACIIGGTSVNLRRNAALAAAYALSESTLKDYRDKVLETVGEKKEKEIRSAVAQDKVTANPPTEENVYVIDKNGALCYDLANSRYFRATVEHIRNAVNLTNEMINLDYRASLHDFYDKLGLEGSWRDELFGWNLETGIIRLDLGSVLAMNDTPCVVLDFHNRPKYGYDVITYVD